MSCALNGPCPNDCSDCSRPPFFVRPSVTAWPDTFQWFQAFTLLRLEELAVLPGIVGAPRSEAVFLLVQLIGEIYIGLTIQKFT